METNLPDQLTAGGSPRIRGGRATLYWQGERTVALVSDLHGWEDESHRLRRVSGRGGDSTPGPGIAPGAARPSPNPLRYAPGQCGYIWRGEIPLWSISLDLPRDAYLEYYFHDPLTGERLLDPFNPRTVSNGFGARNNFFYMPEAAPTPLTARRAEVPHGAVTRHLVPTGLLADDGQREVHLYAPPVRERVPLLVVYDGTDYLKRGLLANIVDNLIAEGRIRPLAMALLQNGGRHRSLEYACSDAVISWLDSTILPLARRELRLLDIRREPGAFGVLGASFGGLMSLYTGLRMPEVFGKVICQSGTFEAEGRDYATVDLIRHGQARDQLALWMDIGRFDFLLGENRRMKPLLKKQGYEVTFREFNAGHNYTAWRDEVWRALEALFPG